MKLFEKVYDYESLYDLSRDIHESFNPIFNEEIKKIPVNEYGFLEGEFKVTIEYLPSEE